MRRGSRSAMYFRLLFRAAALRKGQATAALTAIVVAAAAATAMLNLFVDVQAKLRKEFRKFGANIVVEAKAGGFAPQDISAIQGAVSGHGLAVPFAYTVARDEKDRPIVVAGTDFDLVKKLNPWWAVSAWPNSPGQVLVGVRADRLLSSGDTPFSLSYQGHSVRVSAAGTVRTGAGEDSRVYMSLQDFQGWIGIAPSAVEIAASGSAEEVTSLLRELQQALPNADVRAVRQVTEGEANVLGKTRSTLLWSSSFIVCTAALCVLATLMGWVFDRRRDFVIMKALGASDWLIAMFVAGEAAALAVIGGALGFAA